MDNPKIVSTTMRPIPLVVMRAAHSERVSARWDSLHGFWQSPSLIATPEWAGALNLASLDYEVPFLYPHVLN
jgi:hypothetical protein